MPIEAEPDDLAFDVWRHGWIVANYERTQDEAADLRQQLETVKQENCDLLIGHAELTRRLALAQSIITSLGNPYVQEYPLSQETVIPSDVSGSAP